MEAQTWYRIGFNQTKPFVEKNVQVGVNDKMEKGKVFFLAPLLDDGSTDLTSMRSVKSDNQGYPNGFYPSLEEAKQDIHDHIEAQIEQMTLAMASINEIEDDQPDLKISN